MSNEFLYHTVIYEIEPFSVTKCPYEVCFWAHFWLIYEHIMILSILKMLVCMRLVSRLILGS